jgi:hypothetical protein
MKRYLLAAFIIATNSYLLIAQEKDPSYEIYYRMVNAIDNESVKVEISGNHCQANFCQLKLKMTNKTKDYVVLKTEDLKFVLEHDTYTPKEKNIVIAPFKSVSKTIRVDGDNRFQVDKYELKLKGFYRVPVDAPFTKMEKFKLPATSNSFKTDAFVCKVNGEIVKVTKVTEVPLLCKYVGNSIAILDQSKAVVVLESGQEFATTNLGSMKKLMGGDNILFPGDDKKIKAVFKVPGKIEDMQFANMEIDWKDTFIESKLIPIELSNQKFEKDPGLTEGKN